MNRLRKIWACTACRSKLECLSVSVTSTLVYDLLGAYPSAAPSELPFMRKFQPSPLNMRLAVTKTLAYNGAELATTIKAFIVEPQGGTTTLGIITLSLMTHNIKSFYVTLSISDSQHNNALLLCWVSLCCVSHFIYFNAECCYAECRIAVCHITIMLNVVMLNVVMLSVVMLNIVMLNVVMLIVVAPPGW